jgi:hypothetical protein
VRDLWCWPDHWMRHGGMGRAGREEIPGLLDLHREIVAAG